LPNLVFPGTKKYSSAECSILFKDQDIIYITMESNEEKG
jgi:hypothetical protein